MRLIDADALLKALRVTEDEWGTPDESWMPESDYGRVIKSMPTIDPVKHGHWVRDGIDKWRCSVCGIGNNYAYAWSVNGGENLQDKYCPNCGARMDGGTENETD